MNPLKWPLSCVAGIVVVVAYCVFTFTSWALYPTSYDPITNWLSDLGNSTYNPTGAILYNVGCVLTGAALFPFFFGLNKWHTDETWRKIMLVVTQVIGTLAAFSLIMIGVFSEDLLAQHHFWSAAFFFPQSAGSSTARRFAFHASQLHQAYSFLRVHSSGNQPCLHSSVQYTYFRVVHGVHCAWLCCSARLQYV